MVLPRPLSERQLSTSPSSARKRSVQTAKLAKPLDRNKLDDYYKINQASHADDFIQDATNRTIETEADDNGTIDQKKGSHIKPGISDRLVTGPSYSFCSLKEAMKSRNDLQKDEDCSSEVNQVLGNGLRQTSPQGMFTSDSGLLIGNTRHHDHLRVPTNVAPNMSLQTHYKSITIENNQITVPSASNDPEKTNSHRPPSASKLFRFTFHEPTKSATPIQTRNRNTVSRMQSPTISRYDQSALPSHSFPPHTSNNKSVHNLPTNVPYASLSRNSLVDREDVRRMSLRMNEKMMQVIEQHGHDSPDDRQDQCADNQKDRNEQDRKNSWNYYKEPRSSFRTEQSDTIRLGIPLIICCHLSC